MLELRPMNEHAISLVSRVITLVENRPNIAGRMTLLSRAASRDKGGATKGTPFVAGHLRPAT
jgi:hypothetical protein